MDDPLVVHYMLTAGRAFCSLKLASIEQTRPVSRKGVSAHSSERSRIVLSLGLLLSTAHQAAHASSPATMKLCRQRLQHTVSPGRLRAAAAVAGGTWSSAMLLFNLTCLLCRLTGDKPASLGPDKLPAVGFIPGITGQWRARLWVSKVLRRACICRCGRIKGCTRSHDLFT